MSLRNATTCLSWIYSLWYIKGSDKSYSKGTCYILLSPEFSENF